MCGSFIYWLLFRLFLKKLVSPNYPWFPQGVEDRCMYIILYVATKVLTDLPKS